MPMPRKYRRQPSEPKQRRSLKRRCLGFEPLEERLCFAVFYDFNVLAQTGSNGLIDIEPAASINDLGKVAFVASQSLGQSIYIADDSSSPVIVSFADPTSSRTYGRELQINNSNQIAAQDRVLGGTVGYRLRTWDGNNPGTFEILSRGTSPNPLSGHFDALGSFVSLSNDGKAVFAGFDTSASTWEIHQSNSLVEVGDFFSNVTSFTTGTFFRFASADGDRSVVGSRIGETEQIVLRDITGFDTSDVIASTSGGYWSDLGVRPGISDDGKIVAFYGVLTPAGAAALGLSAGPGIFAAIDHDSNLLTDPKYIRIAGLAGNGILDDNESYTDENGNGVFDSGTDVEIGISSFDFDSRIAIARTIAPTTLGSVFHTAWVGTDSKDGSKAIFASNLKIKTSGTIIASVDKINAGRVTGSGDSIAGLGTVSDVAIHDALNGNGQIAFWATTGSSDAIILADPRPPKVVVISTHGFGNTWNSPIGQFEIFPGFIDKWNAVGNKFEDLPTASSDIHKDIVSYVANWNSSDGWVDAALSVVSSIVLTAQGNLSGAARALDVARAQMVRAGQLAEQAAVRILSDLKTTNLLGDPSLSQNGTQFIQLVGHSRGAAVNAQLAKLLADGGYIVEEYVGLDGYSTDWPSLSGVLGDISIVDKVVPLTASGKIKSATNYRVEDGFAELFYDTFANAIQTVAAQKGFVTQILTTFVLNSVRNALPSWKAPERTGFNSNQIINGTATDSNHINVVDIYLENLPAEERYILDSFVGKNSGISPLIGLSTTEKGDYGGGNLVALLTTPGFIDGNFSLSKELQNTIASENLGANVEPLVQLWSELLTDPAYVLGTYWQTSGPVVLAISSGNPSVQLSESQITSLTQTILIPSNGKSIDFHLGVSTAESGEYLSILFAGNEFASIDLAQMPTSGMQSVPLPVELLSKEGDISFVFRGSGAMNGSIILDDISLVLDVPAASADFNSDGQVNGRDFLAWQRGQSPNPGNSADLAIWRDQYGTGPETIVSSYVAPLTTSESTSMDVSGELVDSAFSWPSGSWLPLIAQGNSAVDQFATELEVIFEPFDLIGDADRDLGFLLPLPKRFADSLVADTGDSENVSDEAFAEWEPLALALAI
jgi:hypothetical protein